MPLRPTRPSRTKRRSDYHHGDLRRALIDAALPLLKEGGPKALTLRAVARAAGVSQTAPYRHFADRAALIAAIAEEGFTRLHQELVKVATHPARTLGKAPTTARGGLQAIALAYVRLALDRPGEYRLMFGSELASIAPKLGARQKVFEVLRRGIVMLQEQKLVAPGNPHAMALSAWALVHGLVMLALDGQLSGKDAPSPETLTITATELMMFGMARKAPPRTGV
jgi:AcrR family transcriptional regulator